MPELPEIETVSRALRPNITGLTVSQVIKRREKLRMPIPDLDFLVGQTVLGTDRRSKYLIVNFAQGQLLVHLGMSGFLHWAEPNDEVGKHDHWDMEFTDGRILRLRDHRRFGCVLWQPKDTIHDALTHLGPEPLEDAFTKEVLKQQIGKKSSPIKTVIMDASVVVGVGNIYANEALFHSKIDPHTKACDLSDTHLEKLVIAIKFVLNEGIRLGGATLRDYHSVDGSDGLFAQFTKVYGRAGQPCVVCQSLIKSEMLGQRNTFWCPKCQKTIVKKSSSAVSPQKSKQ